MFVKCPLCDVRLRTITATHLKSHKISTRIFRRRFPNSPMVSLELIELRAQMSGEAQRERIRTDLNFAEEKKRQGKYLADIRAAMSPQQNAEIQKKAVTSFMAQTTSEQRVKNSTKGHTCAVEKYPDLSARGGRIGGQWWKTTEGRELASERAINMWASGRVESIRTKNREHAISGRIQMIFSHAKPTKSEKVFIALITELGLPLTYMGDGRLRVPTPGTLRHWRCPDFVSTMNEKKIVLLDRQTPEPFLAAEEQAAYEAVGYTVMRVKYSQMRRVGTIATLRSYLCE